MRLERLEDAHELSVLEFVEACLEAPWILGAAHHAHAADVLSGDHLVVHRRPFAGAVTAPIIRRGHVAQGVLVDRAGQLFRWARYADASAGRRLIESGAHDLGFRVRSTIGWRCNLHRSHCAPWRWSLLRLSCASHRPRGALTQRPARPSAASCADRAGRCRSCHAVVGGHFISRLDLVRVSHRGLGRRIAHHDSRRGRSGRLIPAVQLAGARPQDRPAPRPVRSAAGECRGHAGRPGRQ